MTEILFNMDDGSLAFPHADELESVRSTTGERFVPLGDLLVAPEIPFTLDSFKKVEAADLDRDGFIRIGQIALQAIRRRHPHRPAVTLRHLRRMHLLGLGPTPKAYAYNQDSYFESLPAFQREIGSVTNPAKFQFEDWSIEDFDTLAASLTRDGKPPTIDDYKEAARRGDGPGYPVILRRTGGVKALHERQGFPDVGNMDADDMLAWGVRVRRASPDRPLTMPVWEILSRRKRGPSVVTIRKLFDTIPTFNREVETMYHTQEAERQTAADGYRTMIAVETIPASFAPLSDTALLQRASSYLVAQACLTAAPTSHLEKIAASRNLIASIRSERPDLTAGYIETAAVMLNVFDDVWPTHDDQQSLGVTLAEIADMRHHRAYKYRSKRP